MATPPRYIEPDAIYLVTRCVEGRRFLLRPDQRLSSLFVYFLAHYAEVHGARIHAVVVMSTHFHMVVTIPDENVSDLMHDLDLLLSIEVKRLRREAIGVTWEPGGLSVVQLMDAETVEREIAYCIANPPVAGLVWRPEDWPGVTVTVDELGRKELTGHRPPGRSPTRWPETATVRMTWPESLRDDVEAARERIRAKVELLVERAHDQAKREGWKVMSARQAMRVSPYRVAKSAGKLGGMNPHLAAADRRRRIAEIRRLKTFRAEHAECKARWCAGDRDVVFPAGTYWMKKHHGARTEPFP